MFEVTPINGLPEEKLKKLEEVCSLLEPLLQPELSMQEMKKLRDEACMKLSITRRTLRRYLKKYRDSGLKNLLRKVRADAGSVRQATDGIIAKLKELLLENPRRSLPRAFSMLVHDPEWTERVKGMSLSTLYHHVRKAGLIISDRKTGPEEKIYHRFESDLPNRLWQGDARSGIWLPHPDIPESKKRTHLFAWVDDFSRKVVFARYYWDEKLPRMEDCFRNAVLRHGLPSKVYCDNGNVYISGQFTMLLDSLGVRKIHHPPYQAWCKGKIEAIMKTILSFQSDAGMTGIQTLDELNETFTAWLDIEYNSKIHSSTGETPEARYRNNIERVPPRRVTDLDQFNALFFFRDTRIVTKFGRISFDGNIYKIPNVKPGESVTVIYDPFDLREVAISLGTEFLGVFRASKLVSTQHEKIPESVLKPKSEVSRQAQRYFQSLREKHLEKTRKTADSIKFSDLSKEDING